jgi:hypothetical protein
VPLWQAFESIRLGLATWRVTMRGLVGVAKGVSID